MMTLQSEGSMQARRERALGTREGARATRRALTRVRRIARPPRPRLHVQITMGIAEQQSTRLISEGHKDAKIELARAERGALEEFPSAMREDESSQSEHMLAQRYMELISARAARWAAPRRPRQD